jgi:flagellar biosynthesis protein FliR
MSELTISDTLFMGGLLLFMVYGIALILSDILCKSYNYFKGKMK